MAFDAGEDDMGRIWLLLGSLHADTKGPQIAPLSCEVSYPAVPHSASASARAASLKKSPTRAPQTRSPSSDRILPPTPSSSSQIQEKRSGIFTPSGSVKTPSVHAPISPAISRSIAGHDSSENLPSVDDIYKHRRKSVNVASAIRPRPDSFKRTLSSSSTKVEREDRSSSSRSRHTQEVGEGTLNDSDTTDGESATSDYISAIERQHEETKKRKGMEIARSPKISGSSLVAKYTVSNSDLREDHWAEDEKEDESSSECESDDSVASTTAARSAPIKLPSRSHTTALAPLSTSSFLQRSRDLTRTDSHSSVLTVTAGGTYGINEKLISHVETPRLDAKADTISLAPSHKSRKRQSQIFSSSGVLPPNNEQDIVSLDDDEENRLLEWSRMAIIESEEAYRQAGWDALRTILEELAETVSNIFPEAFTIHKWSTRVIYKCVLCYPVWPRRNWVYL